MTRALSFVLVAAWSVAGPAQDPSIAGRWKVNSNIVGNTSEQNCTFTQNEQELSGTCESDQGALKIAGKIDGKKVTWQYDIRWEGEILTLVYAGTLESSSKIVGTVDVQPVGVSGEFAATLIP